MIGETTVSEWLKVANPIITPVPAPPRRLAQKPEAAEPGDSCQGAIGGKGEISRKQMLQDDLEAGVEGDTRLRGPTTHTALGMCQAPRAL